MHGLLTVVLPLAGGDIIQNEKSKSRLAQLKTGKSVVSKAEMEKINKMYEQSATQWRKRKRMVCAHGHCEACLTAGLRYYHVPCCS